ncbi:tetratricopeptide repeat protein [Halalkalibacillus halophilus]|uniref:tetratricopeptide repeat protein n=1 Tax=Halalkalibacillus halophilus TaxID=392827 RepID=UPI0004257859|nr:tetratricopeptide repeat protein [Halalkalibacillus halophilus]
METISEALTLKEQGKLSEAVQKLKDYVSEADEAEQFDIAQLLHEWGLLNDAKEVYEDILILNPGDHYVKLMLSEIHTDLGNDQEVIDLLEDIEPEDEAYIPALVQMADLYQSQGLFEVAEQKLLEAKDLDTDEPIIDLALAELAFSNAEYLKAIPFYQRIEKYDEDLDVVDIKERLAEALSAVGKWEEALSYYEKIKIESPDQMFKYGYTAFQLSRYQVAMNTWNELIELDPDYTSVYPLLAHAYDQEGAPQEAFDITVRGISKDEHNHELYYNAAMYAFTISREADAIDYLKQAIAIDPSYEDAVEQLVRIYQEKNQFEDAKELVDSLIQYEGYPPVYNFYLATINEELENFNEASIHYSKAYESFKEDPEFLRSYGFFLIEEGKTTNAIEVLTKYVNVRPEDEEVNEYLERMHSE